MIQKSTFAQFEATEANLAKLERLCSEIQKLTPDGLQFGNDPVYEERVRVFEDVLGALPKIDGWKNPKGMGGPWRDDHPDNIQATHWWLNGEKGSTRMDD